MKTIKITLLCCLFAMPAIAQNIITIDNSPQSTTTHQTLQDGLDAATSGDIIYIQPTATTYGNGIIEKAITIVGRSHSETNRVSTTGTISVRSSNVIIKGISFSSLTSSSNGATPPPYTGLRLYDCRVTSVVIGSSVSTSATIFMDDVEIQGCVLASVDQRPDSQNILVGNNIITGSFTVRTPSTVVVSNNIFRAGNGNISLQNTSTTATAIFYNNIFKTNSATDKTVTLNSGDFNFSNCLTYNYGAGNLDFAAASGGTYLENDSLLNTDPLFVDVDSSVTSSFAGSSNAYNPITRLDDLTLQAGSPALTGGGGGSEIGLFNSGFNFDYIGNPRDVPTLDIINYDAAVPKNGTINVTIEAKAH